MAKLVTSKDIQWSVEENVDLAIQLSREIQVLEDTYIAKKREELDKIKKKLTREMDINGIQQAVGRIGKCSLVTKNSKTYDVPGIALRYSIPAEALEAFTKHSQSSYIRLTDSEK